MWDEQVEQELEAYEKGRQLKTLVHTPGWEIVVDMLKSYRDKAFDQLTSLIPGDPSVPTAHAAASALKQQFEYFMADLDNAIKVASNPSEELRNSLMEYRESVDVLKQMELTNTPSAHGPRN